MGSGVVWVVSWVSGVPWLVIAHAYGIWYSTYQAHATKDGGSHFIIIGTPQAWL